MPREQSTDSVQLSPPSEQVKAYSRVVRVGLRTLAAALSIIVLALSWYSYIELGKARSGFTTTDVIESTQAKPSQSVTTTPSGFSEPMNVLLVGLDSRTDAQGNPLPQDILNQLHAGDNDGELNTDTMILLHIPADGRSAVAISFPRDSYVDIAGGFGKHKLNSAYADGKIAALDSLSKTGVSGSELDRAAATEGRKNLIKTIEQLIGNAVTINRYVEVNLASFYAISQAVGGVPVCLKSAVKESNSGINLPAGQQVINGTQALAFVRQRYDLPRGDLDRIVRQQAFLAGLAQKVLSADTLTNPAKLNSLLDAVKQYVVLSQGWDLFSFLTQLQGIASGSIQFHTIPTGDNVMIGGADVTLVDPKQVHDFVAGLVTPTTTSTPPTSATGSTTSSSQAPQTSTSSGTSSNPSSLATGIPCVN